MPRFQCIAVSYNRLAHTNLLAELVYPSAQQMEVIAFNAFVDVLSQKLWIIQSLLAWKICCDSSFAMSPKALCCHTWVSFWFKLFIPVFCLIQSWAFSGCVSLDSPHRTVAKWSSQLSGCNFYFLKFCLLTSLDSHIHSLLHGNPITPLTPLYYYPLTNYTSRQE